MEQERHARSAWAMALTALAIIPINTAVWIYGMSSKSGAYVAPFLILAAAQLACGITAIVLGAKSKRVGAIVAGSISTVGAVAGGFLGLLGFALGAGGGAWGRPLRVRGRQLHPTLREGADWTSGPRPQAAGLDP